MKIRQHSAGILLLAILLATTACRSTDNTLDTSANSGIKGQYNVKINLSGADDDVEEPEKQASISTSSGSSKAVQTQTIPFDDNYSITATLVPVTPSLSNKAIASVNPMAATEIGAGIRYKILVYDKMKN